MSEFDEVITIDGINYKYDFENDKLIEISLEKKSVQIEKTIQSNNSNLSTNNESEQIWYPDADIDLWESFLNRGLIDEEKECILEYIVEKELNKQIQKLSDKVSKDNCFIPKLTKNNGNCLFESLSILGLGDNDLDIEPHMMLRNNISSVLLYLRNCIDFFPGLNITPEQIFENSNDIEFVKNKKTGEIFQYNYDMMICDLRTNYSWTRLPTELVLMAISRIYQIKILIYHNKTNFVNEINVWKDDPTIDNELINTIRLGHINEEHYIPILNIPEELVEHDETINNILEIEIEYEDKKNKYKKWAKFIASTIYDSYGNTSLGLDNQNNTQTQNETKSQNKYRIIEPSKANQVEKVNLDEFEIL